MKRYMVIEHFKAGQFDAVYQRVDEQGRMLPEGLEYIDSWVSREKNACFQLMRTDKEALFDQWTSRWSDLVNMEVVPLD